MLLGLDDRTVWASHRPDPAAGRDVAYRYDGFDYWDNSIFRRHPACPLKASELIREALAITLYLWGYADIPADGFHSFIDPKQVKPTIRHGVQTWGYCYEKAGFVLQPELTKARGLLRLVLAAEQLRGITAMRPLYEQLELFAAEGAAS